MPRCRLQVLPSSTLAKPGCMSCDSSNCLQSFTHLNSECPKNALLFSFLQLLHTKQPKFTRIKPITTENYQHSSYSTQHSWGKAINMLLNLILFYFNLLTLMFSYYLSGNQPMLSKNVTNDHRQWVYIPSQS